ncbi:dihydroxyacetone phosphatase [Abditibacteriota bacterium]|nr:dihydroxyacetone phosphatase [Abditibacteriota bacterium]
MKFGYLIDMDGVIYRDSHLIPGAARFIAELQEASIPFMFLTNNSQRTRRDIATKLGRMGIDVEESHVFTCAMATARFLASQKPRGTAYVIGEGGLLQALHNAGYAIVDKDPDYVVIGEGRTLTYEMVETALNLVLAGAKLVVTNLDPNCPTSHGTRPGAGAIVSMIEAASGLKAFSVGKPSPIMMRMARKSLGLDAQHTIMIGDTMETDILGGVQMGYHTVLVLSGSTKTEHLASYAYGPDKIVDSLATLSHAALAAELSTKDEFASLLASPLSEDAPTQLSSLYGEGFHGNAPVVIENGNATRVLERIATH